MSKSSSESSPILEPILDRLDRIEARLSAVEARAVPSTAHSLSLAELDLRIQEQAKGIAQSMLETALGSRVEDLRARLHTEMLESVEATLTRFEQTIDSKVSLRIATIEKALTDQSSTITALSQREIESDTHLQQLISAVGRLCERTEGRSPVPASAKEPSFAELPFDKQLNEALERQTEPVVHH